MLKFNFYSNEQPLSPPDEEWEVVYQCAECGEPIREGEECVKLGGNYYCEHCVNMNSEIAEFEDDEW